MAQDLGSVQNLRDAYDYGQATKQPADGGNGSVQNLRNAYDYGGKEPTPADGGNGSVQNVRNAITESSLGAEDGAVSTVGGNDPTRDDGQIQGGVCTPNDDWTNSSKTAVGTATGSSVGGRPVIPSEFTQKITPTPNRLSKMASQTYSISLYLLKQDDYTSLVASGKKQLPPGSKLIIQSGGIQGSSLAGTRNRYFDVDFYIDEVVLRGNAPSKGTGGPNQTFGFSMTILEPNGITLLQRLNAAIRAEYGSVGDVGINSAFYLMVIRFYGYDDEGNLISGVQAGYSEPGSDSTSLVEKFFPFTINNITYQISSKLVEYNLDCVIPNISTAFGTNVGTIPYQFELSATNVKTLLGGVTGASAVSVASAASNVSGAVGASRSAIKNLTNAVASGNPADIANYTKATLSTVSNAVGSIGNALNGLTAPAKASAISETDPSSIQGLTQALNEWQESLVKSKSQDFADIYNIEIANTPGLIDATLTTPGRQDKQVSGMNMSDNPSKKSLDSKNNYNKEVKKWSIDAGTQIVQFIDTVMRASTFVTSQQNISFPSNGGPPVPQKPTDVVQWYYVNSKIVPYEFDKKRNCYAVKVTYTISPYLVFDTRSPYFGASNKYRGAHKVYNWWFTGLNTEVVDWQIEVKNNYVTTFGNNTDTSKVPLVKQPDLGINEKRAFSTRPNETSQGGKFESTMPAASLADRLYADTDLAETEITILGDPDWIIQTGLFYQEVNLSPWAPDGSVNSTSSPILFEVLWNAPTDYDLLNGIQNVNNGKPNQRAVFNATTITSTFKDGKFTQKVKGTWVQPESGTTPSPQSGESSSESSGETEREMTQDEMADVIRAGTPTSDTDTLANPDYDPTQLDAAADEATQLPTVTSRYAGPVDLSGFDDGASSATQNQAREA